MDNSVSKRIMITLPDVVAEDLERWASQQGRPTANLAAFLVETSVQAAKDRGDIKEENSNSRSNR